MPPAPRIVRPTLRWVLLTLLAAWCSVRPAPLPAELVRGGTLDQEDPAPDRGREAQGARRIGWGILATLSLRTGEPSDSLRQLDGQRVRLAGFVVPLEDFQERAAEFLLVPYYGACIHMPPPPANQLVHAKVRDGVVPIAPTAPVWLEGILRITPVRSVYGAASYSLLVETITPYSKKDGPRGL